MSLVRLSPSLADPLLTPELPLEKSGLEYKVRCPPAVLGWDLYSLIRALAPWLRHWTSGRVRSGDEDQCVRRSAISRRR